MTSALSAVRVRTSTRAPPPAKKPKATPLLWMWTRLTAGRNFWLVPTGMSAITACLVSWSSTSTTTTTTPTRAKATARWARVDFTAAGLDIVVTVGSAADGIDDQRLDDVQQDDPDYGGEVERPERRDELAKHAQVGLRAVAQEVHQQVAPARVGQPQAEREEHVEQEVQEDDDDVDLEQGLHVVGDVAAGDRLDEHQPATCRTRSIASEKAARIPPRSRASSPRAVDPAGEVTSRRTAN